MSLHRDLLTILLVLISSVLCAQAQSQESTPPDQLFLPVLQPQFSEVVTVRAQTPASVLPKASSVSSETEILSSVSTSGGIVQTSAEVSRPANVPQLWAEQPWMTQGEPFPCDECPTGSPYTWQVIPSGLIYKSYLAGPKEPRISSTWTHSPGRGTVWDPVLGGRAGLLRYGTQGPHDPEGFQLDIAGAVFTRLDPEINTDMDAADFRFEVPLTWRKGDWQLKTGYYHISSHVADEFLARNPGFVRDNYVRDSAYLGVGYFVNPDLRLYGEAGWGFVQGAAEPLELQFGADYSPHYSMGMWGTPFVATNIHLREEVDFGGSFIIQAGLQWRGSLNDQLLRIGFHYFNGKINQYSFTASNNIHEELTGFGIWYDF